MEVPQYDHTGTEKGKVQLDDSIFGQPPNAQLIAQYLHVHRQRKALGTKKTKARGEVAGGGRKPWRQKGTGRARHGSTRSPLWVGGGHAHAIRPRIDKRTRMPKKMRRRALFAVLSLCGSEGKISVLVPPKLIQPKTKKLQQLLDKLALTDERVLFVTSNKDETFEKSARNLPNLSVLEARLLNPYDLLRHDKVILINDAAEKLKEVFGNG